MAWKSGKSTSLMRMLLNYRNKLLIAAFLAAGTIYIIVIWMMLLASRNSLIRDAEQYGQMLASNDAIQISESLNNAMHTARVLSHSLSGLDVNTASKDIERFDTNAEHLLNRDELYEAVWAQIDYRYLSPTYRHDNGYRIIAYSRMPDGILREDELRDTSGKDEAVDYIELRDANQETAFGPYFDPEQFSTSQGQVISVISPVEDASSAPIGLVGVNLAVEYFYQKLKGMSEKSVGTRLLLTNKMRFAACPHRENIGNAATDLLQSLPNLEYNLERMRQATPLSVPFTSQITGGEFCLFSAPVRIGQMREVWTLCVVIPKATLLSQVYSFESKVIWTAVSGFVLLFFLLFWVTRRAAAPLGKVQRSLRELALGHVDESIRVKISSHDEWGRIAHSINLLLDSIDAKLKLAAAIAKGDHSLKYRASKEDRLGLSLMRMRNSLVQSQAREAKQRELDKQQAWATQGIAKFAELFRTETDSIETFSHKLIRELTRYTDALIGAFYIWHPAEGDRPGYMQMEAAVAYEVTKYKHITFESNEGLVGRCMREKARVFLSDLPKDYVTIASGLGQSIPDNLLLVPVMLNGDVMAVIELAKFGVFEEYVIQFIENIGSSIASTLVAIQSNINTMQLLEEANARASTMAIQEKAISRHHDQLLSLQYQAGRFQAESESLHRGLKSGFCVMEYDAEGKLRFANGQLLALLRLSLNEILDTHFSELTAAESQESDLFQTIWQEMKQGVVQQGIRTRYVHNERAFTLTACYTPVMDEMGELSWVMVLGYDVKVEQMEEDTHDSEVKET